MGQDSSSLAKRQVADYEDRPSGATDRDFSDSTSTSTGPLPSPPPYSFRCCECKNGSYDDFVCDVCGHQLCRLCS
ncbi:hypothetical protein GX51_00561 [Blastomyces parvus]|uniref:Uncharacterized protein n=1 Tax=Blastomyces parvus TaxID=2060905 RepID=A0A2B7XJV6_9EURO|nr:hypothetical protein GX51_00561 [Blastomyces parvus]